MKSPIFTRLSAVLIILSAFLPVYNLSAANRIWNGGDSPTNLWSVAANWAGTAPVANDTLFFDNATGTLNTNDIAADTQFNGIAFNATASPFTLYGNTVTLGGNVSNNSANAQTILLGMKFGSARTNNGANPGLFIGKGFTNTAALGTIVPLAFSGNGIVSNQFNSTAGASNNFVIIGNWTNLDNPTATAVTVPGFITVNAGGVFTFGSASSAPSLTFQNGDASGARHVVGNTGGTAVMNMINGNLTLAGRLNLGNASGALATLNMSGGTITISATGLSISDNNANNICAANISGGTLNLNGQALYVATRGTGSLNVSNTAGITCGTVDVCRVAAAGSKGTVNLVGGVLAANMISTATSSSTTPNGSEVAVFNFNGGTLRARVANATFIRDSSSQTVPLTVNVQAGGAFIDSSNVLVDVLKPLLHDATGPAIDGGLTKLGTGTLVLTNASTYTGPTMVLAGTLSLTNTGTIANSSQILVTNGAIFDVSQTGGSGFSLNAGQTLGGNGVVTGAVSVASGGLISPGYNAPGILSFSNSLTLNGDTNFFELSNSTGGNNDKIVVAGNLTLTGVNAINITKLNGALQTGRYTLITYGGALAGTPAANLIITGISTTGTRQTVALTNDIPGEIDLIVGGTPPATLTWAGNGANNNWDLTTTADWLTNNVAAQFFNDDTATFGDAGSKTPAVNLTGPLAPASVIVSNTSGTYTFSDAVSTSGNLTGGGSLIKANNGTLALTENAGDNFTGGIQANGGTLILSNNNVAISGGLAVNNGATVLDAHNGTISGGMAITNGNVRIVGSAGVAGGVTLTAGSLTVSNSPTLTGDVNVKGGTAFLNGSPNGIVNVTVNGGSLLLQQDNGAPAPSGNTTIGASGSIQLGNNNNLGALNIGGGATITDNGSLTINRLDDLSVDATLSGTGSFSQADTNTVTVTADNNGFTGPVNVQKGILRLGNNRAFNTTVAPITVSSGATLDLNTFMLTNAPVIASGNGQTNVGAIVNNGSVGNARGIRVLTLANNVTLGGQQRWDLRNVGGSGTAILTNNGNAYGITKVGSNQVSIVSASVDPALANIDIQQGLLSFEVTTTSAGNPASSLTVEPGAELQIYQFQAPFNKVITLNGTGTNVTLNAGSGILGSNNIVGPVSLVGNVWVSVASGANLTFTNNTISGSGNFFKVGPGTNYLNNTNNNYSGLTVVSNGVLAINGASPTNNISVYGDTTSNSGMLSGTSIITAPVTIGDYGTLNPGNGGIGAITLTGGLTLTGNSTNLFEINRLASPNSDLVHGLTSLAANGTLNVTNIGAVSPQYGDVFQLYDAGSYSGTFNTITLPPLTAPLLWNTNVLVNGTVSVGIDPNGNLLWTGANSGDWDTSTMNWSLNASPILYTSPDGVIFDDTAATNTVNLTATFAPVSLLVSNNTKTYIFVGGSGLSGSTSLVKKGNAALILDEGFNDFSGGAVINAGTLQIGNNDANGNFPATGPIVDNGALVFDRTDLITVSNLISGNGSVSQIGSGSMLLFGANTYTNSTFISNGIVQINNTSVSGSSSLGLIPGGPVVITNGGTLDFGGSTTVSALNFTNANGIKQFYVAGAGVGGNGAIINSIATNQQNVLQYVTLTANASFGGIGRFDLRGGPTNLFGSPVPVLDLAGHTLTKTNTAQNSLVNVMVTSGNIDIGQGVMSFEGNSTVNGTGTITVEPNGLLGHFRTWGGAITRPVTLNGGTITNLSNSGGASTNDSPITLVANSTVASASGSDLYINGSISQSAGTFGLTKVGTGLVILPGNQTYSGNVTISAGTLQFGTNTTSGNLPAASSVTDNGTIAWSHSDNVTVANTMNGTGGLSHNGSGTLLLDNPGTLSGNAFIASSVLQVGNNDALGSLPTGNITDNGTLIFDRLDTFTVNGVVSGTGSVIQSDTNTVKLFGANTYTGGTLITNGFLQVSNNTSLGTPTPGNLVTVTNGGALDLGGNATANALLLRAYNILVSGSGVTNGGAIVNSGAGQQFALTNVTLVGNTTFGGGGRWDIRSTNSNGFLNSGGNPYKLTKTGTNFIGIVNITVDPMLGDVDVQNGILDYEAGTTGLGNSASNLFVRAGASLEMFAATNSLNKVITLFGDGTSTNIIFGSSPGGSTNVVVGPVTLASADVVIGGNATGTFSNAIGGAHGLIVNGGTSQRVNIAGTNTYSGNTTVTAGTLALLGPVQLTNSPVITIATTNSAIIDVSGRTTPSAGTLVLANGQTLYGNGIITGNLSVNSGGLVSPGAGVGSIGALNISVSASSSGRLLMEINKSNPGITNDVIATAAPMICGGTLSVTNLGPALAAGDYFKLFNSPSFFNQFTLDLASPGAGLVWNTNNLYVDGSLSVSNAAVTGPTTNATITKVTLSSTNLLIHGTNNNVPNNTFHYVVLSTPNLTNTFSNWTPVVTNPFNPDGTFDYTNPIVPGTPRQFIDIQVVP